MLRMCLAASLLLASASCVGKSGTSTVIPASHSGGPPALTTSEAVAFLHRDATLVAVASNPAALDRATGWAALVRGNRTDVPDLTELAGAGIDVERPAGLALVDPNHRTWVAFASISDRTRLSTWIATRARGDGGMARPSQAGDATVFLPADDAGRAAVIRGDQVLFLWTDGPKSVRDLAAVRLAALKPGDSILETNDYRQLVPALGFGRDLAVYVSGSWVAAGDTSDVDQAMLLEERVSGALRAAREQNAKPAHIATLERQLAVVRQIAAAATKAERFRMGVGHQVGPVVMGAELRDDQLLLAAVAKPSKDSPVARLLPGVRRGHPVAALIADPAVLSSAHLDPTALTELVSAWLEARGSSLGRLREASTRMGADLDRAVLTNMTGEVTFAVWGDPARALQVTLGLKVRDPARARKLVAALTRSGAGSADGAATLVPAAGLAAPLRVAVVGDYLVASTLKAHTSSPPRPQVSGPAARLILAGWMILGGSAPAPPPPRLVALAPDDHPAPPSDEYLGLRGTLDSERARADELRHKDAIATATHMRNLGAIAGQLELQVERDGVFYRAFGQLRTADTGVSTMARQLSDAARRESSASERRQADLADRASRIEALERELERLRKRDIAAWEKEQPPK